jgi:large subunit ribosomal protein L17
MVTSLFRYERINTTKAKAKSIRITAEKLITRAKEDTVHNRRIAAKLVQDKEILAKLFNEIGPRYVTRPGGYTRMLKTGQRSGDAAEVVILELVERVVRKREKPAGKPEKAEKTEPAREEVAAEE